ncbi:type II toxin-antitoxin system Phd/YefM family antitoxin [Brevibacterium gallinarum]|uniref:Antitoxin n=1 Tax=Brevibacterium gallinarum TaxID=2762220 RepID=A0ABR8WS74_9MICO|nr:type II toxin-antitoxin system Phd/YefM family antitoxin [Brevibacterium gallinarum]MBD8019803.1 type II toxin-antitoxin system Phd/YefM family antitoxin [Brevibacterium gallinarum]
MSTVITSREFNRDVSAAMRAAEYGPVTITDHGRPSHVLITAGEYNRITGRDELVGDRLWRNQDPTIEFDLPSRRIEPERNFDQ